MTFGSVAKILKSSGSCVPMVAKLERLYQTEGVPEEESINSFCEKNGVPYEEFDKWFRKTHQAEGGQ